MNVEAEVMARYSDGARGINMSLTEYDDHEIMSMTDWFHDCIW